MKHEKERTPGGTYLSAAKNDPDLPKVKKNKKVDSGGGRKKKNWEEGERKD